VAAVQRGTALRDAAYANPGDFSGRLAATALGSGAAIRGATAVGGARTGRAVSYAIQPGEELVRAGARSGTISTTAATKVPGVSEANIRGTGGTGGGALQNVDVGGVRNRLPQVDVRFDPDAGPLQVDPQLRTDVANAVAAGRSRLSPSGPEVTLADQIGEFTDRVRSRVSSRSGSQTEILTPDSELRKRMLSDRLQSSEASTSATARVRDRLSDATDVPGEVADRARSLPSTARTRVRERAGLEGQSMVVEPDADLTKRILSQRSRQGLPLTSEPGRGLPDIRGSFSNRAELTRARAGLRTDDLARNIRFELSEGRALFSRSDAPDRTSATIGDRLDFRQRRVRNQLRDLGIDARFSAGEAQATIGDLPAAARNRVELASARAGLYAGDVSRAVRFELSEGRALASDILRGDVDLPSGPSANTDLLDAVRQRYEFDGPDARLRDVSIRIRSPNTEPGEVVVDARAFAGERVETETDVPTADGGDLPDVDIEAVDGGDAGMSGPSPSRADARDVEAPSSGQMAETRLVSEERTRADLDDGPSVRTPIEPELTLEETGAVDLEQLGDRLVGPGGAEDADDLLSEASDSDLATEPDVADRLAAETVLRETPLEVPEETQAPTEVTFEAERMDVSQELAQEPVERPSEPANPEPFGSEPAAVESGPELPDEEESLTEFEALFDEEQFETGFATGEELEDLL